jgi:hypothetical protein
MNKYYTNEEYELFNTFSSTDDVDLIHEKMDYLFETCDYPQDLFYFLSKNQKLLANDLYTHIMKTIFEKFQTKNMFEESIYNFLDGWSENFSKSENHLEINVLGEKITRKLVDERSIEKVKDMFYEVLPMLGETELLKYYKDQLEKDFFIFSY